MPIQVQIKFKLRGYERITGLLAGAPFSRSPSSETCVVEVDKSEPSQIVTPLDSRSIATNRIPSNKNKDEI